MPDYETDDQSFEGYSVVFKVLKTRSQYPSQMRHSIKSRKATTYEGHSLKLESVCKLDWLGSDEELLALARKMPTQVDTTLSRRAQKSHLKAQIALSRAADQVYRAMSDAKVFNLSLEMATQYNLCRFVDRSANERTSDKLRTNVLYFETPTARFELARFTNEDYDPVYRLAEVDSPFFKDEAFFAKQDEVPLANSSEDEHLKEVLVENAAWNQFLWGVNSVRIPTKSATTATGNTASELVTIGPILNFLFRPCRSLKTPSNIQSKLRLISADDQQNRSESHNHNQSSLSQ